MSEPVVLQASRRRPRIDLLRGLAIVAMIAYHFTWDLGFLGFIKLNIAQTEWGMNIARGIAASFLTLVGISLALANANGFDFGAFWRRLVVIGGAAALVTIGTWFAFPDAFIFMGVLHCIALSSVMAALFLHAPLYVTLAGAALSFTLPLFVHTLSPWPFGWFLGLAAYPPRTNDYVPLFPWLGFVLTGLAIGHIFASSTRGIFSSAPLANRQAALLARAGRHGLAIYLVHQPILIGALSAILFVAGPGEEDRQASAFDSQCVQACIVQRDRAACEEGCICVTAKLLEQGYFKQSGAVSERPDAPQKISDAVQACMKQ
jgi:uncharacterized membrane protein